MHGTKRNNNNYTYEENILMKTINSFEKNMIEPIDESTMKMAIFRSGYLLERRIAANLKRLGYRSITNRGFIDQETNKTREYDVYADKEYKISDNGSFSIYPTIIGECKNNPQPIVFFAQEEDDEFKPLIDEVTVSGIPAKIWKDEKYISVQEYLDVKNCHHYCVPIAPVSTYCCTFEQKKDKSAWMANHGEELFETFRTLTKALEYQIDYDFKNMGQWFLPEETEKEFIDLSFNYPLVIYQGDIYFARVKGDDLNLTKCDHIQYNPEFYSFYEKEVISYHIDVITEKYLPSFIKIVETEMNDFKNKIQNDRSFVLRTVGRLVAECTSLGRKTVSYRKHLEYLF
jgi:hypothetical protein